MSTYPLRMKMVEIARRDVGRTEVTPNRAPWISKLWSATNYPDGMDDRAPYCAAGMAYCLREWGKIPEVLEALGMSPSAFEKWRCKSASVFNAPRSNWVHWAEQRGLKFIDPVRGNFHAGDWLILKYSHIEMYVDDTGNGSDYISIGYNTNSSGSRDGEGCAERARPRRSLLHVIRCLE